MELEEVSILQEEHQKDIELTIASEQHVALHLSCNSTCAFSKEEYDTRESKELSNSARKLSALIIFFTLVMVVEIAGGFKANSLAVMTDAAHLMTDVVGFSVSLVTVWVSGWKATPHQSFGFNRLEVLGALLSVQLIWLISGILIYEAVDRILHKNAGVKGGLMFAIAAFGFTINLIMVLWLGHDHHDHHNHHHHHHHHHNHDHNLETADPCAAANEEEDTKLVSSAPQKRKISNINIEGAYLHVVADLIQSVGVMIAGGIIWMKPNWLVVDLICTLVFSALVLLTTIPMLRNIFNILMEGTPREIDVNRLKGGLRRIKGVHDIHDLHIWAITVGKLVLSCHVVADAGARSSEILGRIREYCEREYRVHHVTIQIEQ